MRLGGTLSHHHAVGTEHRPWMTQEVSPAGLQALHALKTSLDPKHVLNPGKLLPEPGAAECSGQTGNSNPISCIGDKAA
jgi:alkyldihydroxyacetonephosphate synthase